MTESIGTIDWTTELELYFAKTAERSHGLAWLHKQAETLFAKKRNLVDLPVIIISTAVGFLQVGSTSMFGDTDLASTLLGVGSLVVSVLNTTGTYFGFSKRAEGHRISSIQYARLHRHLKIEMGLPRDQRQTATELLKFVKDTIDRLQEISPIVPAEVIQDYKKKFGSIKDIQHPTETNGLEKIMVYQENPMRTIPETPIPNHE